jgi:hypothetical protein
MEAKRSGQAVGEEEQATRKGRATAENDWECGGAIEEDRVVVGEGDSRYIGGVKKNKGGDRQASERDTEGGRGSTVGRSVGRRR